MLYPLLIPLSSITVHFFPHILFFLYDIFAVSRVIIGIYFGHFFASCSYEKGSSKTSVKIKSLLLQETTARTALFLLEIKSVCPITSLIELFLLIYVSEVEERIEAIRAYDAIQGKIFFTFKNLGFFSFWFISLSLYNKPIYIHHLYSEA